MATDDSLKLLLLAAHQDIVPVVPTTVDQWTRPPYSGFFDGKQAHMGRHPIPRPQPGAGPSGMHGTAPPSLQGGQHHQQPEHHPVQHIQ
ncbi:hypothetical protein BJ912DRAFT_1119544 [Pholiota molesta]|nr:hypothetical protein BJ912DRAFT_1119544 [Pholiota molesta]